MAKSMVQQKLEERYDNATNAVRTSRHTGDNTVKKKLMKAPSPYDNTKQPAVNEMLFEDSMIAEEIKERAAELRSEKFKWYLTKSFQILLSVGCAYLIFLIYGLMSTTYVYDARGNAVPQVLSLDEIKEVSEYNLMHNQYIQARALYERVLVLDYRIALGYEDPLLIAPEYEKTLEDISSLSVQIGALSTPAQYAQTMNMLLKWVQNDIALYCQNMSAAITQNNSTRMNNALTDRSNMYNDFKIITQNVATLGSRVSNVDISDILAWSPELYLQQYVGSDV